jgi:hypothetical protein
MDMETVTPMKTVNDLMKELREGSSEDKPGCNCHNCSCKDEKGE